MSDQGQFQQGYPMPPAPKKGKGGLIAAITALVLVVGSGAAAAGYFIGNGNGSQVLSPENVEEPQPDVTEEEEPAPEPEPEPEPVLQDVLLPSCDTMNQTAKDENLRANSEMGLGVPIRTYTTDEVLQTVEYDPDIQSAINATSQNLSCFYAVSFHNGIVELVGQLDEGASGELATRLHATGYDQQTIGHATVYTKQVDSPPDQLMPMSFTYTHILAGNAWVLVVDNGSLDYLPAAINSLIAHNPSLSPGYVPLPLPSIFY